jgi:C_GCAxxG_C_C family probable redox protein
MFFYGSLTTRKLANRMEEKNGRSFNCAERTMIGIDRDSPSSKLSSSCMQMASVLGGGISGFGEVCGAVSGAVLSLGLIFGTNGTEEVEEFKAKRVKAREFVKQYMQDFVDNWGSVQCRHLVEMDEGKLPPAGSLRPLGTPKKLCDEYVDWSVKKVIEIRKTLG